MGFPGGGAASGPAFSPFAPLGRPALSRVHGKNLEIIFGVSDLTVTGAISRGPGPLLPGWVHSPESSCRCLPCPLGWWQSRVLILALAALRKPGKHVASLPLDSSAARLRCQSAELLVNLPARQTSGEGGLTHSLGSSVNSATGSSRYVSAVI